MRNIKALILKRANVRPVLPALLLFVAAVAVAAEAGYNALPLSTGVYVIQAKGNNILVSAGDDGVVLVDAGDERIADKVLASVKTLSSKPIRFVIDTHVHGDHAGGNALFQKFAPVIAHHNVRTRMMGDGDDKAPPAAWPLITFDSEMVLHLNGEEIRVLKVPAGHTDGDAVVFFKNANVVHMGDVYMSPAVSFGAKQSGGSMLGLIASLEFVIPLIPADAKIVPGHGAIASRADMERGLDVLKAMKEVVEDAIRGGKTMDQLVAEKPFDKWKSEVPAWMSSMDGYVKNFYRELTAKK